MACRDLVRGGRVAPGAWGAILSAYVLGEDRAGGVAKHNVTRACGGQRVGKLNAAVSGWGGTAM